MLLIPIRKTTEPSTDKKTMLVAFHGFLPQRSKGVFADCIGVHGVPTICCLTDCIDEAPPGTALTACFHWRRGMGRRQIVPYEFNGCLAVFVFLFLTIRAPQTDAFGQWCRHSVAPLHLHRILFCFVLQSACSYYIHPSKHQATHQSINPSIHQSIHPVRLPRFILILLRDEIRSGGGSRKGDNMGLLINSRLRDGGCD